MGKGCQRIRFQAQEIRRYFPEEKAGSVEMSSFIEEVMERNKESLAELERSVNAQNRDWAKASQATNDVALVLQAVQLNDPKKLSQSLSDLSKIPILEKHYALLQDIFILTIWEGQTRCAETLMNSPRWREYCKKFDLDAVCNRLGKGLDDNCIDTVFAVLIQSGLNFSVDQLTILEQKTKALQGALADIALQEARQQRVDPETIAWKKASDALQRIIQQIKNNTMRELRFSESLGSFVK